MIFWLTQKRSPTSSSWPEPAEVRYQWVRVRLLHALDLDELGELRVDARRTCVPKKVAAAYEG